MMYIIQLFFLSWSILSPIGKAHLNAIAAARSDEMPLYVKPHTTIVAQLSRQKSKIFIMN